jgi:oxalate decarboxylase/phosphoglucose isomerase-like protein (cupin superfamily)
MDIIKYKQIAQLIRDNETYKVYDLPQLEELNLSLTELYPQKSTTGHTHPGIEEIYIFIDGQGSMEVGQQILPVKGGDVVLVPQGDFHRVHNQGNNILSFWTIFKKYQGRGK